MALNNINKLLQNKVETLQEEVVNAQSELKKWQDIILDYQSNPEKYDLLATLLVNEQSDSKRAKKK